MERAEVGLESCDHTRACLRDMAGWQTSMETLQIIMKHDEGGGVGSQVGGCLTVKGFEHCCFLFLAHTWKLNTQ